MLIYGHIGKNADQVLTKYTYQRRHTNQRCAVTEVRSEAKQRSTNAARERTARRSINHTYRSPVWILGPCALLSLTGTGMQESDASALNNEKCVLFLRVARSGHAHVCETCKGEKRCTWQHGISDVELYSAVRSSPLGTLGSRFSRNASAWPKTRSASPAP